MKEHPILFSGAMVRAILEGRKTQTRRVIKMHHRKDCPFSYDENDDTGYEWVDAGPDFSGHDYRQPCRCINFPYGDIGDRLWVRETFNGGVDGIPVVYRATNPELNGAPWKPSIHMPRTLSRINLEVTAVRVEQIQDITREDVYAEGLQRGEGWGPLGRLGSVDGFSDLWDSINAKRGYSWVSNPWVWVIEFERE